MRHINLKNQSKTSNKFSWMSALKVYLEPVTIKMLLLGFAAGVPYVLVFGTLSFRLRESGIDLATIGYLSWITLAYGFKWLWAPLVDHIAIPYLHRFGRRRSWLLLSQILVMTGLISMGLCDPKKSLTALIWASLLVAFASATHDIVLDAMRIESAVIDKQAAMAAAYQTGYRLAMIWGGAGSLWLASALSWTLTYFTMALSMSIGVTAVYFTKEPTQTSLDFTPAKNFYDWISITLFNPFIDFFKRFGTQALLLLLLIGIYRISDVVMGGMAYPFYVDMGYTKEEIATISKIYGVIMTLLGTFLGGALSIRFGLMHLLSLGAILSSGSNLLFAWLATKGHDITALIYVISVDNISSGIASAAFIAYLSSLTNLHYSASQYAAFSSMMIIIPKFIAGYSGVYVNSFGYINFFIATSIIGIPVILLIWLVKHARSRL